MNTQIFTIKKAISTMLILVFLIVPMYNLGTMQESEQTTYDVVHQVVQIPSNYDRINSPFQIYNYTVSSSYPDGCCGRIYELFDFSDPSNPEYISSVSVDLVDDGSQTDFSGSRIYEVNSTHFVIFGADTTSNDYVIYLNYFRDILNPEYIMTVNITEHIPDLTTTRFFTNNSVITIQPSNYNTQWISRLDLTDPFNPVLTHNQTIIDAGSDIKYVGSKDGYIFLSYYTSSSKIFSYSTSQLSIVNSVSTSGFYYSDFQSDGDFMMAKSSSELMRIDISDPSDMVIVQRNETSIYSDHIGRAGPYSFMFNPDDLTTYIFDNNFNSVANYTGTFDASVAFTSYIESNDTILIGHLGRDESNNSILNLIRVGEGIAEVPPEDSDDDLPDNPDDEVPDPEDDDPTTDTASLSMIMVITGFVAIPILSRSRK